MADVTAPNLARQARFAAIMLIVATVAWAISFSLAKDAGGRLNELAGVGAGAFFGPVALQGVRFVVAAVVWFAVLPMARRGWTWLGVWRGLYTGVLLGVGIMLQHLSLEHTTPASTAFLTGLTVLWVPIILCIVRRSLPSTPLLIGVILALAGLYLMLGDGLTQFRKGEVLGLACSVVFSFHLLAVSKVSRQESPWRMCGAQFLVCGLFCLVPAMDYSGIGLPALGVMVADQGVIWRLLLILIFPTFLAFGLMNFFQHQVDSTRATLIYQGEPVLAAAFDLAVAGRGLGGWEWMGAGLIVCANLVTELMPVRATAETGSVPAPGCGTDDEPDLRPSPGD